MKAFRFSIQLKKPLPLKDQTHTHRSGVLLEKEGRWAEASPLPGFSTETVEDVIAALRGERDAPPSLQFALAALDEPAIEQPLEVPWNYLLLGNRESVLAGVESCIDSSCRAAKLKVGREELSTEIALVKEVRDRLPPSVSLRLDANQAWTFDQASRFMEGIGDVDLEYIEEPLEDASRLEEFYAKTGVHYALDETLLSGQSLDLWPFATALVCKPTILGGRSSVERLVSTGKPVVFSAAFESGVGIARIVQLAAEFSPNLAAGLDTLDWLSDDLLLQSPQKQNGMFRVTGQPIVDTNRLERIEL